MRLVTEGSPCSLLPPSITQLIPGAAGEDDGFLTHVITPTSLFKQMLHGFLACQGASRSRFVFSNSHFRSQACLDPLCLILGTTTPGHREPAYSTTLPAHLGTQVQLHDSNKTWLSMEGGMAAEALSCPQAVDVCRWVAKPIGILTLVQYCCGPRGAIAESSSPSLVLVYSNTVPSSEDAHKHH